MTRALGGLALSFLVAAQPCLAQQDGVASSHPPPLQIQVNSRLVLLDVTVTDKLGHPITNLGRDQFVVTEDKVPQTIKTFEAPGTHTLPAGKLLVRSSGDLAKIGMAPVTILVLDELNTPFADRAYAQQMMEKYLQQQPAVMPSPTLVLAVGDSSFSVIHDYTQDREALLNGIRHHFPDYPWTLQRQSAGDQMSLTLGALDQIADSSRGTPGRKNVIWVGTGYPSVDETGMAARDVEQLTDAIEIVTRRMMGARVTLYTIDPGGPKPTVASQLITGGGGSSVGTGSTFGTFNPSDVDFVSFATATGGTVLFARNDLTKELTEEVGEGDTYYTIGYVPTGDSDAAKPYRAIQVTMKDPSLTATTRQGYFANATPVERVQTDQKKKEPKQLSYDLLSAAKSTLTYNGLQVKAVHTGSGFTISVGAKAMQWVSQADGNRVAEATVFAVAYDARHRPISNGAAELTERIGPGDSIDKSTRITLTFPFVLPPRAAMVRLVVRDAGTGAIGTADVRP